MFVQGFQDMFQGNTSSFVDGIVAIVPLIGVIVIIFGLTFFLTRMTIFRKEEQSKYARMVAIGLGLIGLVQQSVYNTILNLSTSFLVIAFIFIVIMMSIMFVNISRRNHYDIHKETLDAQKTNFESRKATAKVKDDFKKDQKYYTRSRRELQQLDEDLKEMSSLGRDELKAVDKLIDLVTRAHSASAEQAGDKIHAYVKAMNAGISGLISNMNHEHKHLHRIDHLIADIQMITRRWSIDEKEEEHEDAVLGKIFSHYDKHHGGGKIGSDLSKIKTDIETIKKHLREIRVALKKARQMEHRIKELKSKFDDHTVKQKHDKAEEARDAITSNDFKTAYSKLDNLRYIIAHQRELFDELHVEDQALKRLFSHIEHHEKQVISHIKGLKKDEGKASKDEDKKLKKKRKFGKDALEFLDKVIDHLDAIFNKDSSLNTSYVSHINNHFRNLKHNAGENGSRLANDTGWTVRQLDQFTDLYNAIEDGVEKTGNFVKSSKNKDVTHEHYRELSGKLKFLKSCKDDLKELHELHDQIKKMDKE